METRTRPTITTRIPTEARISNEVRRLDRIVASLAIPSTEQVVLRAELIAIRNNLMAAIKEA